MGFLLTRTVAEGGRHTLRTMTRTSRALRSIALPISGLALAGMALTACGGSSDSGGSEADCSQEALNSAASNATGGTFGGVEEFTCDGGYAVVQGKMNDQYLPLLFKAEGSNWVPVEILNACQAGEVPAKVAEIACA